MGVGTPGDHLGHHGIASARASPRLVVANRALLGRLATAARASNHGVTAELGRGTTEAKLAAADVERTGVRLDIGGTPAGWIAISLGIAAIDAISRAAEV